MTHNQSGIREAILIILDENDGEIQGTEKLAQQLNAGKPWLIKCVRVIERLGHITIIPSRGGRGNTTVYKRNRNSPGMARKHV
jgi:hypothetical protein